MPNWRKVIVSGSSAELTTLKLTGLSGGSSTKSVMMDGSNNLETRTLGSNAFNSTTIPTNNNQLDNGAGYTTNTGTVTQVSTGTGLDGSFTTSGTITLDLSELTDMTADVVGSADELILLDNGAERRKLINEIKLSQFNNDSGFTSNAGDITAVRLDGDTGSTSASAGSFAAVIAGGNAITTSVSDATLTVDHDDTSTQSSVNNSGNTVIQDVTLDTYGHVTGLTSKTLTIPAAVTNNNELDNGAGYTTNEGTVTSVSVGTGLDVSNSTTTPSITLDLSEFTDMTSAINSSQDELILLDNGAERRKLISEIPLSAFNNDSGFTTNSGTVTGTGTANRIARWSSSTNISSVSDLTFDGVNLVAGQDGSTGGRVRTGDGSSSSPAFSFVGDTNTGFYSSTTDTIAASTGGTQRLTINSNGLKVNAGSLGVNANADSTNGVIRASNDVIAFYSSDERLKENVKPIENALDKVSKINGVTFDWIENMKEFHPNEGNDVGVIAQEIEKVLPEVVETRDSGYKAVKYEKIVPLLIESIKDLKAEIEELKGRL